VPETIENTERRRMTVSPNQIPEFRRQSILTGINRHNSIRPVLVDAEMQTDGEPLRQVQEMEVQTDPKSMVSTKI